MEPVVLFASRWWPAVPVPLGILATTIAIGFRLHTASVARLTLAAFPEGGPWDVRGRTTPPVGATRRLS
ncbi:hypothetical protein GA0070622_2090 [Micromonospora sediminicola]|uniref:Uncharacterized protein n=1 Tax=Micromonospora sediminicola TaxID=946078 RepID=A0A1A9B7X7_9ACTN|nr:hypothetical protein [Micromonospora sediminicola]SBT65099.1 hypothetical protein GA0070622_2090 [Micromonospora sediminicola]